MRKEAEARVKPKVVVVDVDPGRANKVARFLRENDFDVVSYFNPRGVLGEIRRLSPDAVVVEVVMPGISGFEIAARMQADSRLSRIPVIFTTDIQNSGSEYQDYFPRPLDKPRLLRSLQKRISEP